MSAVLPLQVSVAASSNALGFPILTSLVVVPLLGALFVLVFGRMRAEWNRLVALVSTISTGALSIWVLQAFDSNDAEIGRAHV